MSEYDDNRKTNNGKQCYKMLNLDPETQLFHYGNKSPVIYLKDTAIICENYMRHCIVPDETCFLQDIEIIEMIDSWNEVRIQRISSSKQTYYVIGHVNPDNGIIYLKGVLRVHHIGRFNDLGVVYLNGSNKSVRVWEGMSLDSLRKYILGTPYWDHLEWD